MRINSSALATLSGALFGIGFVMPALWPLALVGVVPLLYLIRREQQTARMAFLYGWIAGFVLHLCALAAIFWGILPIDWFGIHSSALQVLIVGASWLLAAATLGTGTGLFLLFALPFIRDMRERRYLYLTLPLLWAATEWAGAIIFSIVSAGPGSLIGAHFSLGHIGYLLASDIAIAQAAVLGGVYLLSALAIAAGTAVYRFIFDATRRERLALSALFLIASSGIIGGHLFLSRSDSEKSGDSISIAVVSADAPPKLYLSRQEEEERADRLLAIMKSVPSTTQAVFLPEGATFGRYGDVSQVPFLLVVDSENIMDAAGASHSIVVFHYSNGERVQSSKQFVLPMGEYLPYMYRAGLRIFASADFAEQVLGTRSFVGGRETHVAKLDNARIAVRFCDEVMSPFLYSNDAAHGASLFANISSYSWFHGSPAVFREMQLIARVRAIENRRSYAQSSNMASAYILDAYGRLVGETRFSAYDVVITNAPSSESKTPYTYFIYVVPYIFMLTILVGMWRVFVWKDR